MAGVNQLINKAYRRVLADKSQSGFPYFRESFRYGILILSGRPCSTELRPFNTNRYPSPLERSAQVSRPLPFFGILSNEQVFAECGPKNCAKACRFLASRRFVRRGPFGMWSRTSRKTGENLCGRPYSRLHFSQVSVSSARATAMQNADLWAQRAAQPFQKPQAETLEQAQSLVGLLACSATMQASANNLNNALRGFITKSNGRFASRRGGRFSCPTLYLQNRRGAGLCLKGNP